MSKRQSEKPTNSIDTLIGANTEIRGDVAFTGGLRIDGKVSGNILTANDEGSCTLVLSDNAVVTGNVTVPHLIINGTIQGNVSSTESIELQPKAEIIGDVSYKMIEMALGASVNGNLVRDHQGAGAGSVTHLKSVAQNGENEKT